MYIKLAMSKKKKKKTYVFIVSTPDTAITQATSIVPSRRASLELAPTKTPKLPAGTTQLAASASQ